MIAKQTKSLEPVEMHRRDLKEAMFYLSPVFDMELLFSLLKTFYEEKEARALAFKWYSRNDRQQTGSFDDLFTQAQPQQDPLSSLTKAYLNKLYGEATQSGWTPKSFRKGKNQKKSPSKKVLKELERTAEEQELFEQQLLRTREREKPVEEKSYLEEAIVNYKGGLYYRPLLQKSEISSNPEVYESKLTKIADCEVHVVEAIKNLREMDHHTGYEDEIRWRISFKNDEKTASAEITADDLLKITNFSRVLISRGFTPFSGKPRHFQLFQDFIITQQDYPTICTSASWGEINEGTFLFQNGIYDTGQSKFHASDSQLRIPYNGKHIVCNEGSEQVRAPLFRNARPDSGKLLSELFLLWEELNGTVNVRTTVSFAIASLFSRTIVEQYHAFPLLFSYGERGTGKSTSMDWFMALFGYQNGNRQSISKSNTTKSVIRRMTLPRYFPFFLDDYRNHETNTGVPDLTSLILNWFHHIGSGMAKKSTDNQTLDQPMKANVVMTGNDKPSDPAVLDRLLVLDYTRRLTKNELRKLNYLTNNSERLPEFIALLLEHYLEVKTVFFAKIPDYKDLLADQGFDGRTCFKWSVILAAHDTIPMFLPSLRPWDETSIDFFNQVVATIKKEQSQQVENAPLIQFFETLNIYAMETEKSMSFAEDIKVLDERHYRILTEAPIKDSNGNIIRTQDVLAIHFGRIWEALNRQHTPFTQTYSKQLIQSLLESSPYYVAKSQQVFLSKGRKGREKANLRCYFLDLVQLRQTGMLDELVGEE